MMMTMTMIDDDDDDEWTAVSVVAATCRACSRRADIPAVDRSVPRRRVPTRHRGSWATSPHTVTCIYHHNSL